MIRRVEFKFIHVYFYMQVLCESDTNVQQILFMCILGMQRFLQDEK